MKYYGTRKRLLCMDSYNSLRNRTRGDSNFIRLNYTLIAITVLIYVTNNQVLKSISDNKIIHGQLNDVLGVIVFLSYSNLLITYFGKKSLRINSLKKVAISTTIVSLWWEYITPYYHKSTSDPYDLLAYGTGSLIYYVIIQCHEKLKIL
jgi:hypothetical protein